MKRERFQELLENPEKVNQGVGILFNGDAYSISSTEVPREEWLISSRFIIEHISHPNECSPREIAQLDQYIALIFETT